MIACIERPTNASCFAASRSNVPSAVGATAHMVDEHITVADIEALTEIYAAILEAYFR